MAPDNFLHGLEDDGLHTPLIRLHSLEKIRRHNYYAGIFSASMKGKWAQRAYIGLYSGSGRARIEPTGEIIETTALSAIRQAHPFTHYIFVDKDPKCVAALQARVARIPGPHDVQVFQRDVADVAPLVRGSLPRYGQGKGLLSFCFVDPYNAELKFDVFRKLGVLRMDFLVLLMLGNDVRRNFRKYYNDRTSTRIADMIDCPDWRSRWDRAPDKNVIRFLLGRFDDAMVKLGYLKSPPELTHSVMAAGTGVLQYVLAFYSKNPVAHRLWRQTLARTSEQTALPL